MRTCPDCGVTLAPIELLGLAFRYVTPAQKRALLGLAWYPEIGTISPWKCPQCGLVRLYAETDQDDLPRPAEPPEPEADTRPRPVSGAEEPESGDTG
jgi:hypothetical protein